MGLKSHNNTCNADNLKYLLKSSNTLNCTFNLRYEVKVVKVTHLISFLIFALCNVSAQAAVVCKGSAFGLDSTYTFQTGTERNLSLHVKTLMGQEIVSDTKGTATYSSTVKMKMFGEESIFESYYIFVPAKNSYTELIGLSRDMKSMARSRPMPASSSGNFMVFVCSGSI